MSGEDRTTYYLTGTGWVETETAPEGAVVKGVCVDPNKMYATPYWTYAVLSNDEALVWSVVNKLPRREQALDLKMAVRLHFSKK